MPFIVSTSQAKGTLILPPLLAAENRADAAEEEEEVAVEWDASLVLAHEKWAGQQTERCGCKLTTLFASSY